MLEMAVADFYNAQKAGRVQVLVKGDDYYIISDVLIGEGTAYTREEIEWAAMTTVFDVEYIQG
ncbi:MAG: hypothetical protein ACE5DY_08945 [Mariprofundaceae bacterium]